MDTKKKELVGNYANAGQQWLPAKQPRKVKGHDFPGPEVPRAFPYGIYDLGRNAGFVNVGTDHDTGAFAVASIRGWWRFEGRQLYPDADTLLITADGGGSNGSRLRLWKLELQAFADETELALSICHFPPGTSKWNKIEHRLFSFISSNWRGEPLRDYQTIVNLIAKTTTAKGLKVTCRLDRRKYPTGRKVSDDEMTRVNLKRNTFHGDWNYMIRPNSSAFDGLTQQQIAERVGISLSGAKSRVQRGREQLKTMLQECCSFEFDRRGKVIGCEPRRNAGCQECGNQAPADAKAQPLA